jgi:hypothetical protein
MTNLSKYRKFSYYALAGMTLALLLSLASFWNVLLSGEVKHEGWVLAFFFITYLSGCALYILAYKHTDVHALENIQKSAFESGRDLILKEIEMKEQAKKLELKVEDSDIDVKVDAVLSGLKGLKTESGFSNKILALLAKHFEFVQGIMYIKEPEGELFKPAGEYALTGQKPQPFSSGENLNGQVAETKSVMILYDIPEDYFNVSSGLGNSKPRYLIFVPVVFDGNSIAVIELASFRKPDDTTVQILNKLSADLGLRLNKFVAA